MQTHTPVLGDVYVRVLGKRLNKYVEFEFSVNDEYLSVELVLPEVEFENFCIRHKATLLAANECVDPRPGLYQRSQVADPSQSLEEHCDHEY